MPLLETAAALIGKRVLTDITGAALKPISDKVGEKKDKLIKEWGVPDPTFKETLRQTIARGYIIAVESITNAYISEQSRSAFLTDEQMQQQQELKGKIDALKDRHIITVATELSEYDISPTQGIDDDRAIVEVLLSTVKEDFGHVPNELLSKFESQLFPQIQEYIWQQLVKTSGQATGNAPFIAFIVQTLKRIDIRVDDIENFAAEFADQVALNWRITQDKYQLALDDYLRSLKNYCNSYKYLTLTDFLDPSQKPLDEVYVPSRVIRRNDLRNTADLNTFNLLREAVIGTSSACILLQGEAGVGKSTLLRQLAKRAWGTPEEVGLEDKHLPMIVSLQSLALVEGVEIGRRLKNALDKAGELVVYENLPEDFFTAWPQKTGAKWLLLLDGLDEIPADKRAQTLQWVETMLKVIETQGHRSVLTSRVVSDLPATLAARLSIYDVVSFSDEQRRDFAFRWFKEKADEFLSEFARVKVADLSDTPLLLTIAAAVYSRDGLLPETRNSLYERLVNISTSEALERGLRMDLNEDLAEVAHHVLEHLALVTSEQPGELSTTILNQVAAKYLLGLGFTKAIVAGKGSRYAELLGRHSGLFICRGSTCEWAHPTIREYLAACALKRQLDEGNSYEAILKDRLTDKGLDDVLVGLVQITDQPSSLIRWMCEQVTGDGHAVVALIALESFENSAAAKDEELRAIIINALIAALRDGQAGLGIRESVKSSLVEFGAQAIEFLIMKLQELKNFKAQNSSKGTQEEGGRPNRATKEGRALYRAHDQLRGIIEVLGRIGDERAIQPLTSLMEEDSTDHFNYFEIEGAKKALKTLYTKSKNENVISDLLAIADDKDISTGRRSLCLQALGFIGFRHDDVPPILSKILAESENNDPALFRQCLYSSTRLRDISQTQHAIKALTSSDIDTIGAAAWFLMKMPTEAAVSSLESAFFKVLTLEDKPGIRGFVTARLLTALLNTKNADARKKVAEIIRETFEGSSTLKPSDVISTVNNDLLPELYTTFLSELISKIGNEKPPRHLRDIIVKLASEWQPKNLNALATLWQQLLNDTQAPLSSIVTSLITQSQNTSYAIGYRDYRKDLLRLLAKCRDPEFIAEACRLLELDDWVLTSFIADMMWVIGSPEAQDPLLEKLEKLSGHYERDQRIHILRALGTCASKDKVESVIGHIVSMKDLWLDLLEDVIWPLVWRKAITANKLIDIINSEANDFLRSGCLVAIARLNNPKYNSLFQKYAFPTETPSSSQNVELQETAVRMLGFLKDQSSSQALQDLLTATDDPSVAEQAAESLSRLGIDSAVPDIEKAFGKFAHRGATRSFLYSLAHFHKASSLEVIKNFVSNQRWFNTPYYILDAISAFLPDPWAEEFILDRLERWGGPGVNRGDQETVINTLIQKHPRILIKRIIELYSAGKLDQAARQQLAGNVRHFAEKIDESDLVEVVKYILCDSELSIRELAGQSLAFVPIQARMSIYSELQQSPNTWKRACGVYSLGFWAEEGSDEERVIHDALFSSEEAVRYFAGVAVNRLHINKGQKALADIFLDKDPLTRLSGFISIMDSAEEAVLWRLDETLNQGDFTHLFLDELYEHLTKRLKDKRKELERKEEELFLCRDFLS